MFSTLLFNFILCRAKRGEEATNMIVDGLLSDEDDASLKSYLSSDSCYSSETDQNFNNDTFAASRSAKVQTSAKF